MKDLQQSVQNTLQILMFTLIPFLASPQSGSQLKVLDTYNPVSPNAASLGKYGVFPVNYNLGTINASVPIYTINTGKQQLPISLSYNTSGIRVNDLASWVGLGWTLHSGGAIIRNVKGRPGPLASYSSTPPSPEVLDLQNAAFNETNYNYLYRVAIGQWDSQPDEFIISGPGISGSFYLDENNNNEAVFKDQTRARVTVISNSEMEVLRADGTVLRFGTALDEHDATEVNTHPVTSYESAFDYVSTWYLTEMIAPNGNDTIYFRYKNKGSYDYPVAVGERVNVNGPIPEQLMLKGIYPNGTYTEKKYLDRIDFNNGYVLFNSVLDRDDLADEYRLISIKMYSGTYNSGTLVDEYTFHHSNFSRSGGTFPEGKESIQGLTGVTDFNSTRMINSRKHALKLDSITVGKNGIGSSYTFAYNSSKLPLRGSNSQDYWGYANNNIGTLLPRTTGGFNNWGNAVDYDEGSGDREANGQRMKAASLEKITYPTGGNSIFELEPHQYTEWITETETRQYSSSVQGYGPGCEEYGTPYQEKTFTIGPNLIGQIKLSMTFSEATSTNGSPTKVELNNQVYYPSSQTNSVSEQYQEILNLTPGTYTLKVYDNRIGAGSGVYTCAFTTAVVTWAEEIGSSPVEVTRYLGGLRVKSIKSYDGISLDPVTNKLFEYGEHNLLHPSNDLGFKKYMQYDLNLSLELSTNLYYDNNIGSPPAMEYKNVVEYDIDPVNGNVKGKTSYYYETIAPQRLLYLNGPTTPIYFKHPQADLDGIISSVYYTIQNGDDFSYYRTDEWRYGFLKRKEIYKGNGSIQEPYILLNKQENVYDNLFTSIIKNNYVFVNDTRLYTGSSGAQFDYANWNSVTVDPENEEYGFSYVFSYLVGEMELGRKALTETTTTNYDSDGNNPVIQKTFNFYDNPDHLQVTRTETIDSIGNSIQTKTFFPDDISNTSVLGFPILTNPQKQVIDKLKSSDQHHISKPIQVEKTINGNKTVQRSNFREWSTSLILSDSIKTLKGSFDPLLNTMETRIVYDDYDNRGNTLQLSKSDGSKISYIWGYNKEFPVAKVENATFTDVMATGINESIFNNSATTDSEMRTELDKIRSHPTMQNSNVTTYTYEPLVGVTSITDARGNTVYYEYDELNRLKLIKDADGNLVTDYKYHFKNQ